MTQAPTPTTVDEANALLRATTRFWRHWLSRARIPDHELRAADPALRARDQGTHVHADGRDRGRADDVAARDPGRGAQLGLPLHVDSRLDVHAPGAALPRPRLGGRRVHAVHRRSRAQRRRRPADHVRDRRPAGSDRDAPRGSQRLRRRQPGPDRERRVRPAPERRVRRRARLGAAAHPPQPAAAAPAVAADPGPGRVRQGGVAAAGPGDLGGSRQAAALRLLEADVLGGDGPRREARGDPRRERAGRRLERGRGRDQGGHPRARGRQARRARPALRHRVARRLDAAGGAVRVPPGRRRAHARERARDRRRADRARVRAPLPDRRDRRRAVRQGGHVRDLLVLAGLRAGDHRRDAACSRSDDAPDQGRVAAGALRRGVRRRNRPAPRELPAGVLAPRAGRGRRPDHPRRTHTGAGRMSDYDVIVIGSGAGGGTLVRHLAPSGKRILLLERGGWLRREPQNWLAQDVFVDGRYVTPDTWYYADGSSFQPQVHYYVGGATKLYGAALYRLRAEDFGELQPPRRDLAGLADRLRGHGAVLHQGRAALPGPRRARRGSDRPAGERSVSVPRGLARAPDPAAVRRPRQGGPAPVPRAVRDPARREQHALQQVRAVSELRRLPVPRARQIRRRGHLRPPRARAPKRDPADRRRGGPARDQPRRHRSHGRGRQRQRQRARPSRATSWSSRAGPRTAPSCCSPPPPTRTRTGSPTALTRSGATTCSTTARPCSHCPRKRTRRSSRRRSGSTTSTSAAARTSSSRSATCRWSASPRRRCSAARNPVRRGSLRTGRSRRSPGTPSTSGSPPRTCPAREPGHARPRWQHHDRLQGQQRRGERPPVPQAQGHARESGHAPRPPAAPSRLPQERDPGRRLRASGRHLPIRHRPRRLRPEPRLPRPRARQPVRRRHELLPEHRCGQPGAHRDGERDPGRRPPARTAQREPAATGARPCLMTGTSTAS